MVPFSAPVVAVGRFEIWVKNFDRQLMSAIAHDVETAIVAIRQHGNAVGAPCRSALNCTGSPETIAGGITKASIGKQSRLGATPSRNQPTAGESPAGGGSRQPSVQARLLARSAHWTAAVEASFSGAALGTSPSRPRSGTSSREGETNDGARKPGSTLQEILSSVLLQTNTWAEELCQPGVSAYNSVATSALTTQALHQRDVLDELLQATSSSPSVTTGSMVQSETATITSAAVGYAPPSSPITSPATSSIPKEGDAESANFAETATCSPFLWTCHLRHYYTPPEEALSQNGRAHPSGSNGGRDEDQDRELVPPPPPPLIRVGIGPWNVSYGLEYAGTLERLWLSPLSERCLLHAVHSAKVGAIVFW